MDLENPKISVIIIAHNEEDLIDRCIENLLNQTFDSYEIIAVDSKSNDNTKFILKSYKDVKYLRSGLGRAKARNKGLEYANGEIIFFLDADIMIDEKTLEEVSRNISSKKCVGFPIDSMVQKKRFWSFYVEKRQLPTERFKQRDFVVTGAMAVHKSKLEIIDGFNENYEGSEDTELCNRLKNQGVEMEILDEPLQTHIVDYGIYGLIKRWFRIGKGLYELGEIRSPSRSPKDTSGWEDFDSSRKIITVLLYYSEVLSRFLGMGYRCITLRLQKLSLN